MGDIKRLYRIKKFQPMWLTNDELENIYGRRIYNFINISGRLGGKTFNMRDLVVLGALNNPQFDIVVLRANSSQLKQSVFLELKKLFFEILPIDKFMKIQFRSSPPLQITLPAGNEIIFGGVGLGSKSGANQSRGKTAERRLKYIIIEETQEIFSGSADGKELLQQAIATYVRFLDEKNGKIIYLGNRDRNVNGKFNVWCREKEKDSSFLTIETNWHDIAPLLTQPTLTMIMQEKELNPNNYKYMYLGIPVGGNDLVYGAFTFNIHVMNAKNKEPDTFIDSNTSKEYKFTKEWLMMNCEMLYIGVDGSTVRDMTVFTPIFVMKDTRLIIKCGDIFQHDPKKNGQIRNNILVDKYVREWLQKLIFKYALSYKTKMFVVDGHNTDLIDQLRYQFGGYCQVFPFTKKDLESTTARVNNAFSDRKLLLTNESWTELISNFEIEPVALYNELETVCWREDKPDEFNAAIPNDRTDSIRYPIAYHANPYQLQDFSPKRSE